jgi:hypothetical protein
MLLTSRVSLLFCAPLHDLDSPQFITGDKPRRAVDKTGGEIEARAANRGEYL